MMHDKPTHYVLVTISGPFGDSTQASGLMLASEAAMTAAAIRADIQPPDEAYRFTARIDRVEVIRPETMI